MGRAVGQNQLFCILLKIVSLDFFNILHKVRGHIRVKTDPDAIFGEFLVLPILAIFIDFCSKHKLFCILFKIASLIFSCD